MSRLANGAPPPNWIGNTISWMNAQKIPFIDPKQQNSIPTRNLSRSIPNQRTTKHEIAPDLLRQPTSLPSSPSDLVIVNAGLQAFNTQDSKFHDEDDVPSIEGDSITTTAEQELKEYDIQNKKN